jgi:hypothetical protein
MEMSVKTQSYSNNRTRIMLWLTYDDVYNISDRIGIKIVRDVTNSIELSPQGTK